MFFYTSRTNCQGYCSVIQYKSNYEVNRKRKVISVLFIIFKITLNT